MGRMVGGGTKRVLKYNVNLNIVLSCYVVYLQHVLYNLHILFLIKVLT